MPAAFDPDTPPYDGLERQPIHPNFTALFATYGPAFSPTAYENTTASNKEKMGISLAHHQPLIHRLLVFNCTSKGAMALIYTLVCLAVELSNEGYLDIKPWRALIRKFGAKSDLYVGKAHTLTPRCSWFYPNNRESPAPRGFAKKPFVTAPSGGGSFPSYWL